MGCFGRHIVFPHNFEDEIVIWYQMGKINFLYLFIYRIQESRVRPDRLCVQSRRLRNSLSPDNKILLDVVVVNGLCLHYAYNQASDYL